MAVMTLPAFRFFPNYSLLLVCACYAILALVLQTIYLPPGETLFQLFACWEFSIVFSITALLALVYRVTVKRKPIVESDLLSYLWAFMGVYFTVCIFATMKSIIPIINPYGIDETLIEIEKFLHLGFLPTYWAEKIVTNQQLFYFLDFAYILWFIVMYLYVSLAIVGDPHSRLRERFLFSFAAVWLVAGNIAATLLSSVGPIFLSSIYDPAKASTDMTSLTASVDMYEKHATEMGLLVIPFKGIIMEFLTNENLVDLNAASAMPSLHIGIVAIMMFHARHLNTGLFIVMLMYLMIILAGSVLLCWHYAIDGYVAILISYGVWKFSGLLPSPERPWKPAL